MECELKKRETKGISYFDDHALDDVHESSSITSYEETIKVYKLCKRRQPEREHVFIMSGLYVVVEYDFYATARSGAHVNSVLHHSILALILFFISFRFYSSEL